ncbi:MAG: hypothetical protein L0323_19705 [Planctomycetes bacterium]|nr:hypothetical protein [Planctomycetota bacterium]
MRRLRRWAGVHLLPAVLGGGCASSSPVQVSVEFLDPISTTEFVPLGDLHVYPSGGTEPPAGTVRIANLRARWESEEERLEARRLLFAMASRLGADSIVDYREETERREPPDPPPGVREEPIYWGSGWKAVPWAVGFLTLAVLHDSAARKQPAPRGEILGCAARRM